MREYIVRAIAQKTIDSFDAHNAPELIRCKDCKHLTEKEMSENCDWHEYICSKHDEWLYDLNWFCADGERR